MCRIRRRHWNRRKCLGSANQKHQGRLQVHQNSRLQTHNWKMALWSHPSRILWQGHHSQRNGNARSEGQNFPLQSPFLKIKETSARIEWPGELLSKIHTTTLRKTHRYVWTSKSRCQDHRLRTNCRQLRRNQRQPIGSLRTCPKTARSCKTIRPHDGCELPCIQLCTHDKWKRWTEIPVKKKNICTSSFGSRVFSRAQLKVSI